jgi:tetratricopeptide (TPR) repeat protein
MPARLSQLVSNPLTKMPVTLKLGSQSGMSESRFNAITKTRTRALAIPFSPMNLRNCLSGLLLLGLIAFATDPCDGADAPPLATTNAPVRTDETNSQEILRAWLQLQEQLHITQLSIEQSRQAADKAAAENARLLGTRLDEIERALSTQRARELESLQSSNRVMIVAAAAFGGVGCVAMLLMVWFQWRAVHRLAEISAALPLGRAFGGQPALAGLPGAEAAWLAGGAAAESNQRLLGALEKLEKRLLELEHNTATPLPGAPESKGESLDGVGSLNTNGNSQAGKADKSVNGSAAAQARISQLLAEGQKLLEADQPQEAIASFDAVLALNTQNGEALVKKGAALEKLRKWDEAVEHYNQAIAADSSLTIAYLHKGGLFNRMERFSEALECYELALRTQEKQARNQSAFQGASA